MSLDYHPGDIVDGYVLGTDNAWHDLAAPETGAEPGTASQPQVPHHGRERTGLIAALVVIAVVAAAGLGMLFMLQSGDGAENDPVGADQGSAAAPLEAPLQVGDCLEGPFAEGIGDGMEGVPCASSHMGEVVLLDQEFFSGAATLPGPEAMDQRAMVACESAVATYTGEPFSTSPYGYWYFAPSAWTWMQGDRGLMCVATTLDENFEQDLLTTGSIAEDAGLRAQPPAE